MHNYLIKLMILLGALAVICANAGVSSNIIHAATLSASGDTVALPFNSSITSVINSGYLSSRQASGFLPGSQGTTSIILSPTQPLGSLVQIAWSELDIPPNQPVFSGFLVFPNDEALNIQVNISLGDSQAINGAAQNFALLNEANPVATLFNNAHEDETIYCNACHGSPNIGGLTKITHIEERISDHQGNPASIVECDTCHIQNPVQTLWHIHGVE